VSDVVAPPVRSSKQAAGIVRALVEGAVLVVAFALAILLLGLPIALVVKLLHVLAAWLF